MTTELFAARAPSNIALIKYMGKVDASRNLPANASLSMTLYDLCTWAEIARTPGRGVSRWEAEQPLVPSATASSFKSPKLSEEGIHRILRHVERVRSEMNSVFSKFSLEITPNWKDADLVLKTANTFPASSGIASSASSFAAVTLVTAQAAAKDSNTFMNAWDHDVELRRTLASISQSGSGSSCRSFEGPWVLWESESARKIGAEMPSMAHFVLLLSSEAKNVSSSEAHSRVKSSPLWEGRVARANQRVRDLQNALSRGDITSVSKLAWTEAWEMHSLFHTSAEPFSYWVPETIDALRWLSDFVTRDAVPPIVTMDAGPNIHVSVPEASGSFVSLWRERLEKRYPGKILQDRSGKGAEIVPVRAGGLR